MTKDVTAGDSLRNAFGKALEALAPVSEFVVFDADVAGGTGLAGFRERFPDRFVNCGIAEQSMVTAAAGYALASGRKAVCSTFAQFGKRAREPFELAAVANRADVLLALSHVGLDVGPDGASAQCLDALATWTSVPGLAVVWPPTPGLMAEAVEYLVNRHPGPAVLLTGRSPVGFELPEGCWFEFGRLLEVRNSGPHDVLLVGAGPGLGVALRAYGVLVGLGVPTSVACAHTLAPFDGAGLRGLAAPARVVVTVEDGGPSGLYSLACAALGESRARVAGVYVVGLGESGEADDLYERHGLTPAAVVRAATRWL